jgi:hypothetical protein
MSRHYLLALTNAVPGQDAELNRWYDEQHLADVLKVPGVVRAQRLQTIDAFRGPLSWTYLTLYELNTADPGAILQELGKRIGTELMPLTGAMDTNTAAAVILQDIGTVRT